MRFAATAIPGGVRVVITASPQDPDLSKLAQLASYGAVPTQRESGEIVTTVSVETNQWPVEVVTELRNRLGIPVRPSL